MWKTDLGSVRPTFLAAGAALASTGFAAGLLVGMGAQPVPVATTAQNDTNTTAPTSTVKIPPWRVAQPSQIPLPAPLADVPPGSSAPVASELAASGVPEVALRAYEQAADTLERSQPSCGLHWSLLAAVGRVETNHGRFGGSQLRTDGTTSMPIRGPQLNGSPFARIVDTDDGRLDGDTAFDRAVGPMQFIPSTWAAVAADGNLDGRADPDNIFDAALSAGVLLCSGNANLFDVSGMRAAVLRYNHSDSYADLVLTLAGSYRGSVITVPEDILNDALVPGRAGGTQTPSPAATTGAAPIAAEGTSGITTPGSENTGSSSAGSEPPVPPNTSSNTPNTTPGSSGVTLEVPPHTSEQTVPSTTEEPQSTPAEPTTEPSPGLIGSVIGILL